MNAAAAPYQTPASKKLEHDQELVAVRYSPCGKYLFGIGYQPAVVRWSVENDAKSLLAGHSGWIQGLAFHPDKIRMFSGDSWGGLRAWNYADAAPAPLWTVQDAHRGWMRSVAISPDGAWLATCASDRRIKLWSTSNGALQREVATHTDDLFSVQFHPSGSALVWGDMKGALTHWDLAAGKVVRTMEARTLYLRPEGMSGIPEINDVGGVRGLTFDAGGKILAAVGCQPLSSGFVQAKPTVILFDWESGKVTQTLQLPDANGNDGLAYEALFHPAGYVAVASSGQTGARGLWCWKLGEAAPLFVEQALPNCRSISLHPDGSRLAVAQTAMRPGALTGNVKAEKKGEYPGAMSYVHIFNTAG